MSNKRPVVLGIIPARSGSKSIPRKNIAIVAGKPLIAHTIQAALDAKHIDRVIVSTDSQEIADMARSFGAEVPFLRPPELAQDDTPGIEPILHAVRWLNDNDDYHPHYVMVLQPTSPLRTAEDIKAAVQLAQKQQADSVVSVCPAHQHPYWMKRITDDGRLVDFLSLERTYTTRQDLPPAYALNGAIYLVRCEVLLEHKTFYTDHTYAYVMSPERSLDIDTSWDLYLADLILKERMKREND
jgi:N-acylneuraminate cytidylyltransferase/CMP-N,N'-diacetyllegionaminic acid synthase